MKRKIVTAVIAFILCAAVVPTAGIYSVMAENEDTLQVEDGADYAALSGVWKNEDAQADETLTLSADGLFVYHTGEGDDVQGYLEYVDEYNDGNGRYDMYNRMGMWLEGFYLDSADTLHMGNDGAAVLPEQRKIRQKRIRKVRLKTKTVWKRKAMSSCQINAIQDCALFITIPVGKEGISIPI